MSNYQRSLDQYELQQCLRRDTTSEVWKAFDTQQRRYVTIMLLRFTLPPDEAIPRFLRETRPLVALRHPYLVPIFEVRLLSRTTAALSNNSEAYLVMDYIEGLLLTEYLQTPNQTHKMLSPAEIMQILAPIGEAIDSIHQQGIIHSLITPSSILLSKSSQSNSPLGEPKLIDLGRHNTYDPHQLSPREVGYIAPEIIQGETNNVRSDLYSLGIILYEMSTGTLPFRGATTDDVISQQLNAMPPSPVLLNPSIGPGLTAVMMRALAKDPSGRFPSASAMIHALGRAFQMPMPQLSDQTNSEKSPQQDDAMSNPTFFSPLPQQTYPPGSSPSWASVRQTPANNPPSPAPITHPIPALHQSGLDYYRSSPDQQNPSSMSGSFDKAAITGTPQQTVTGTPTPVLSGATSPFKKSPRPHTRPTYIVLTILMLLIVVAASIGAWFFFLHPTAPQRPLAGHAFFVSSGLLSLTSSSGITDRLEIRLQNMSAPQPGKSYYVWLEPDTNDETNTLPLLIGTPKIHEGQVTLNYTGDANNTNLLSKYSRLLITEEDASSPPVNPSPDPTAWVYSAIFSHTPNPRDTENHFSLINHLRHLLSQDPKLAKVNLAGGLDMWLYRNTLKILEWSGSARDLALANDDTGLIRRQLVRILDYLDSSQYVQTENLPPDLAATPVLTDPKIARVGLLEISAAQQPPGYLKHIGTHLTELTQSPGITPEQKELAVEVNTDINNVQSWLINVHTDATELLHMPADQLVQAKTFPIFNDMFAQANNAFVGQTDPHTGEVKEGVAQIHYKIQSLATFDITACTGNTCTGGPF
jgi:serine/threonine protein kinase